MSGPLARSTFKSSFDKS